MDRIVGVIPARLESVRLPRKPLREISGRPMIVWVYERARRAPYLNDLLVATDSVDIQACCQQNHIPVQMTSREHRSGTDRLVEVMNREPAEIYVNIQGDEPMITARHIELLIEPFRASPETEVTTLKVAMTRESALNPNNVKVVTDPKGRALYFSRALIPFDRDGTGTVQYYKHLGLYAYRASALQKFSELAPSKLEQTEKLEQLRFLENGINIVVCETHQDAIGVDTEDDLERVEHYFRNLKESP